MLVFELIGCICLAFFIANSMAVRVIKNVLAFYLIWYDESKYLPGEPVYLYTRNIPPFNCPKCLSFWLSICICYYNSLPLLDIVLISFIVYTVAKRYDT